MNLRPAIETPVIAEDPVESGPGLLNRWSDAQFARIALVLAFATLIFESAPVAAESRSNTLTRQNAVLEREQDL